MHRRLSLVFKNVACLGKLVSPLSALGFHNAQYTLHFLILENFLNRKDHNGPLCYFNRGKYLSHVCVELRWTKGKKKLNL